MTPLVDHNDSILNIVCKYSDCTIFELLDVVKYRDLII